MRFGAEDAHRNY